MEEMLLQNGMRMPVLGLGTWQLTGETCKQAVSSALRLGYTHIDTADIYQNHKEIGQVLSSVDRQNLFLTTKVWRSDVGTQQVVAAVKRFLVELHTEYIDLLLIHWPSDAASLEETFAGFSHVISDGLVRGIGVSNFSLAHLRKAMDATDLPILVNQVECHILLQQKELRLFCKEHDIQLVAYSPLGRGNALTHPVLQDIAKKHEVSSAQVALAWLRQHDIVAIPKASGEKHLQDNLDSLRLHLTEEEMQLLDAITDEKRVVNPGFAQF